MKTFKLYFIEQAEGKTAVIAYGRYNPPTIGHEKLIDKVEEVAKREHADAIIAPSHSQDNKKNPLTLDEKISILTPMSHTASINTSGNTLITLLQDLQQKGYTKIIHIAGSDRIPEFERIVNMYNNKADKSGNIPFSFNTYEFESAGERDPDSEGVEGMSASKLRELAKQGNYKEFAKGMSSKVSDDIKHKTYQNIRMRIK